MGGFGEGNNPFNFNKNLFNQSTDSEEEIDNDDYIDFEEVEDDKYTQTD